MNPDIPQQVRDVFATEGKEEFAKALPELVEPMIAIDDANFSAADVKGLLDFHETPLGQTLVARLPQIPRQGSIRVGERVAQQNSHQCQGAGRQSLTGSGGSSALALALDPDLPPQGGKEKRWPHAIVPSPLSGGRRGR